MQTIQKMKLLGAWCYGIIDAESDSTLRVFEGWWHGRHFARIVRNRNGNLSAPYLYENGDKVVLNWNYLDNNWNSNNPGLRHANRSFSSGFYWRVLFCKLSTPTT